jgi:exodeoxyribonuclease V beta subunit
LVAALNQFYTTGDEWASVLSANEDHPIRYLEVQALRDNAEYTIDGEPCPQPLVIQYKGEEGKRPIDQRRSDALRLCAAEITALLQSARHRIKGRPVTPGDIAVLLPTKDNITELHDLLRARGVPCITSSQESVFATDMARELQVVLHAVAHVHDMAALRAAAATRLWGWSYEQLLEHDEHAPAWKELVQVFQGWHKDWQARGVQQVVEALLVHMAPRYLATTQGERALTDLRHLGELLAQQAAEQGGAEELLAWLRARRNQSGDAGEGLADAARLRIEADGDKVQLLTLHGSKGLEFPIVFLPLMWDHDEFANKSGLYLTSDKETGRRLLDVTEEAQEMERQEEQDERFRVLYVALTRAVYACHLYALPPQRPKNGNTDNPATGTERSALDVMLSRMVPQPLSSELGDRTANIAWIEGWQLPEVGCYVADDDRMARGPARPLPTEPSRPLAARHSFTSLRPAVAMPRLLPLDQAQSHPVLEALAPSRGAAFGNAVHAILERRQLQVPLPEQYELVRRCLLECGALGMDKADEAADTLVKALAQRLQAVLEAPLAGPDAIGPRLYALEDRDLRTEMGFSFAIAGVDMSAWRGLAEQHGAAGLVPISNKTIKGMMRGSIDLVFRHEGRYHLLDYKSNHLGGALELYQDVKLDEAMGAHHYPFQALLYTVALERYLRQRIRDYKRDEHLGDCWYLFIRAAGLDPQRAPGAGIWRHRFDDALLDEVSAILAASGAARQAS